MTATAFDFDTVIDRRSGNSTKWNKYPAEVLPMWVADMDFRAPPAVIDALHAHVDHGVFGYGRPQPPGPTAAVLDWLQHSYGWAVDADWLVWLPGLVCGLNVCCRAVGAPGDHVMSAVPVYHHLFVAPTNVEREALTVPLAYDSARRRWSLDLDALDAAVTPRTSLFILCNPHNPVGRAFDRDELTALAALCERHDITICSDEIHCQLILDRERRHVPLAALDPAIAARTITLLAPSKTYNVPGLGCAYAIIPNRELRQRFKTASAGIVPHANVLGFTATEAAYRHGADWLAALLDYLRGNLALIERELGDLSGVTLSPVEATYLAWLDLRDSGLERPGEQLLAAGVGLSDGTQFGSPGFARLNFACPRSLLETALARIRAALKAV